MTIVRTLFGYLGTLLVIGCTATVTSQMVGVAVLASKGVFEPQKRIQYAGILYGLDPLDMAAKPQNADADEKPEKKRDEIISERVQKSSAIADRQLAIRKGTDDIRSVVFGLKAKRERQELSRKVFESYLQQLETENVASSLREVQITLETLPPKQAKDILYTMLTDPQNQPTVMADVVSVVKAMPADKIRKIIGEFKTDSERAMLHDILVEIGHLDDHQAKLTGTQP